VALCTLAKPIAPDGMSLQALRELYGILDEDWYALSDVLRGRASRLSEVQRQRRSRLYQTSSSVCNLTEQSPITVPSISCNDSN
jgi:hypothetical protein